MELTRMADINSILMGKPNELSYDTQTDQSSLQRKKLLIKKLMDAAMQQDSPLIDTGAFKVANWAAPLGKLVQAGFSAAALSGLDKEEADVAAKNAEIDKSAGDEYDKLKSGYTKDMNPVNFDDDGNRLPGAEVNVKGDTKAALLSAATSKSPRWQKFGIENLHDMNKEEFKADAEARKPWTGVVDNNIVRANFPPGGGPPTTQSTPGAMFGPLTPATESQPATYQNLLTGQPHTAGTGMLKPPTPPGQAFNKDISAKHADILAKGREEAIKGREGLSVIKEARETLQNIPPEYFGPTADPRIFIAKLAQNFGIKMDPRVQDLEKMNSMLGLQLIDKIRLFAPVTDTDIKIMERIVGSTSNSKKMVEEILAYTERISKSKIGVHKEFLKGLGGKEGYGDLREFDVDDSAFSSPTAAAPGWGPVIRQ
jgi:hypothetical protein